MSEYQIIVCVSCTIGIAFMLLMFLVALQLIAILQRIECHLDTQGPELMKQTRWLQIMAAHAYMQRSYLQKLCVRAGVSIFEKEEYNDPEREAECSDAGADVGTDYAERPGGSNGAHSACRVAL